MENTKLSTEAKTVNGAVNGAVNGGSVQDARGTVQDGITEVSTQVGGQVDNSFFSKYKYFLNKYRYIIFFMVSSTTFYIAHKRQSFIKVAKMLKIS